MFNQIDKELQRITKHTKKQEHENIWIKNCFGFADARNLKWHKTAFILLEIEKIAYKYIDKFKYIFKPNQDLFSVLWFQ